MNRAIFIYVATSPQITKAFTLKDHMVFIVDPTHKSIYVLFRASAALPISPIQIMGGVSPCLHTQVMRPPPKSSISLHCVLLLLCKYEGIGEKSDSGSLRKCFAYVDIFLDPRPGVLMSPREPKSGQKEVYSVDTFFIMSFVSTVEKERKVLSRE